MHLPENQQKITLSLLESIDFLHTETEILSREDISGVTLEDHIKKWTIPVTVHFRDCSYVGD